MRKRWAFLLCLVLAASLLASPGVRWRRKPG